MGHITREALEKKREEVDRLWQAANIAKIAAAKAEEEYKIMRYDYIYIPLTGKTGEITEGV